MNNLSATGNIGKNAELRYLHNGDAIATFSLAIKSGYGEKAVTTWINCNVWGKRAETLCQMLLKGATIGVNGELSNRAYTTKDGAEKYSLELRVSDVTLLGAKQNVSSNNETASNGKSQADSMANFDDDISF
jgi:single-strand DNA-binding protein